MKKIFLILFSICSAQIYAQKIVNGDFAINSGNGLMYCANNNLTAPGLADGHCLNWNTSHGTPNFPFSSNTSFPNAIDLIDDKGIGEGIVGGYPFKAGRTYRVEIRAGFTNALKVAIGKGPRPNNDDCANISSSCEIGAMNGAKPNDPPETITYSNFTPINAGLFYVDVSIPTSSNYEWIWIYLYDPTSCGSGTTLISVNITPHCVNEIKLFDNLANGDFYGYWHIYAGSSYGTTSSMTLTNQVTVLEAVTDITFAQNFTIAPTGNTPFIAQINQATCYASAGPISGIDNSMGSLVQTGSNKIDNQLISVYPNPAKSEISIEYEFTETSNSKINVYDLLGRQVYTQSFGKQAVGKQSLKVDVSSLNNGMYTIELVTDNAKAVSKFNIAK